MGRYRLIVAGIVLLVFLACSRRADAYSVLSHEEVVDMAWLPQIVPLLKARYPNLTDDDIRKAHAYAYGGSVIQDIGYYPFGSHEFSDLVHYVRSGDFVAALIRESTNVNEYAFALGALAHYCGDVDGHATVNVVTGQENPKLSSKFGPVVTYDDNPVAHVRTEFGFDVVEVAHGRYSQDNYRDFIEFQVSKRLMEQAFLATYRVPVDTIMKNEDLAIGSYRWAVSTLIPQMTKVAWVSYQGDIQKEDPGYEKKTFVYRLRRTEFEKQYGKQYRKPGFGTRMLAFLIRLLPKVGPLRSLQIKVPDAAQQDLYLKSINLTVDKLNGYLIGMQQLARQPATDQQTATPPDLPEIDLDTGRLSRFGEYRLADVAYGELLDDLLHDTKKTMTPDIRQSFADFYQNPGSEPEWYAKKAKDWTKLQANLAALKALPPADLKQAVDSTR